MADEHEGQKQYGKNARKMKGHPVLVLASGGFIGGMFAGGIHAGFLGFALLSLACAFGAMAVCGHWQQIRQNGDVFLGTLVGYSTVIPLPAGFLGLLLGKSLWG